MSISLLLLTISLQTTLFAGAAMCWWEHAVSTVSSHRIHFGSIISSLQVVGMGLLLTFIGLQSSKIVVPDKETMVTMGDLLGLEPVLAIGGLAVIASLHFRCEGVGGKIGKLCSSAYRH
jgi:xanthine/uracil/vitamin C permease (AzgA family)